MSRLSMVEECRSTNVQVQCSPFITHLVITQYRVSYISVPLVADIEILYECSPCCRYRGSYMSVPLVVDIEDLT